MKHALVASLLVAGASAGRVSELWTPEQRAAYGYAEQVRSALPHTYVATADLPKAFTWGNVNGTNYLTRNINQHIPQYCGACWGHAALSALADRIKIARAAQGVDINLSLQHVLNCGDAGSCHGGDSGPVYQWVSKNDDGVAFESCNPYLACSAESKEGFCGEVDTTCKADNVCRTCSTFSANGGFCAPIVDFPRAKIAEYGTARGEDAIMKEVYARGPVACGISAGPIENYKGGIAKGFCPLFADHAVSIVGWGEENGEKFWNVRNSWGEYWGEVGHFRVQRGGNRALCLEQSCDWATPAEWSETNTPCGEDGTGCDGKSAALATGTRHQAAYVDPSVDGVPLGRKRAQ